MSPDFLNKEVLLPFTKADPFTPGAGLGLGLAQRMIEILGGKLAIASTLNKGTLVHIEIPLHLLNEDNDSDQDELEPCDDGNTDGRRPRSPVRQDGIYLAGFNGEDLGTRRVGKSLLRTLKLHSCRIVTEIHYASLIVAPEGVSEILLAKLASRARPGVQITLLSKAGGRHSDMPQTPIFTPSIAEAQAQDFLQEISTTYLKRPLRPSLITRILKPSETELPLKESFVSPVVGGAGAKVAYSASEMPGVSGLFRNSSSSLDTVTVRPSPDQPNSYHTEIIPSSPTTPRPTASSPALREPEEIFSRSQEFPTLRPALHEQASDPLPAVSDPVQWSSSSDSSSSDNVMLKRPPLKEASSTPIVPETAAGDTLKGQLNPKTLSLSRC